METAADRGADALGAAGDQHDPAFHARPGFHVRLRRNLAHRSSCRSPGGARRDVPTRRERATRTRCRRSRAQRARHEGVRAEIAAGGGCIPFARYMDLVLYARGLGYYAAGARKLGAAGDFVTAPELTPLFGSAVATQVEGDPRSHRAPRDRRAGRRQRPARRGSAERAGRARRPALALCDPRGQSRSRRAPARDARARAPRHAGRVELDPRAAGDDRRRADRETKYSMRSRRRSSRDAAANTSSAA